MTRHSIVVRDPLVGPFREVEELMDHLLRRRYAPSAYQRLWAPRVDVYESEREFVAVVELAGVGPDGVTVEVEEHEVTIVGERPPSGALPEVALACLQLEIPYGAFERRLVLPEPVDAEGARATFEEGVLTIRLPKTQERPRRVQVPVR